MNQIHHNSKMNAIIWTQYGPPESLQLQEVEKPIPKDDELLIRIHATTVTAGDCEMRSLKMPFLIKIPLRLYSGIRRPKRIKILGQELAGEVVAVGKDVSQFKKGDQVFGAPNFGMGTYAEYVCIREDLDEGVLMKKPTTMSYEEAATIPVGGLNALYFLQKANIQKGQKVLINGAGGSIGTVAIQLAKLWGAEVTAVDSDRKLDILSSIGADHVIDYTKENFTKSRQKYDVIFDIVGKASYSGSVRSLKKNGMYLLGNPTLTRYFRGKLTSIRSNKQIIVGSAAYKTEDLIYLKNLIEAGKLKAVIDKQYPLAEIPTAHKYVESGAKVGNVVITISSPP